ncbi:MAG TPA: twin-arginine translocase subunit TatC [archaeon]|nr:twin-arginine translocase subunit TatC [archaeon]
MTTAEPDREKVGTIWEHIAELSRRLRVVLYAVVISTTFFMVFPANASFLQNPFAFYDPIVALVLQQVVKEALPAGIQLIAGQFTAPLAIYFIASVILGVAVSSPVIAYEAYRYVEPALYAHEQRAVYPFLASFTILFVIGAVFGYRILTPFILWAMIPFFKLTSSLPIINVMDFYNLVFITTLVAGFSFTMPVFFVLLVRFGVLKTSSVTTRRRYVYAALYIITAIITPDGGPIADIALFVPMAFLLELAVFFGKRYEKEHPRQMMLREEKPVYLKCRFCGGLMTPADSFCPDCGKSRV